MPWLSLPTGSSCTDGWQSGGAPENGQLYMLFRMTNDGPEYHAALYRDGVGWLDPRHGTKELTGFLPQSYIRIPWPEKGAARSDNRARD